MSVGQNYIQGILETGYKGIKRDRSRSHWELEDSPCMSVGGGGGDGPIPICVTSHSHK